MRPNVVMLSAFLSPFRSGAEACAEEVALRLADRYDITIVTARLQRDVPRPSSLVPGSSVRVVYVGFGFPIDKWLFPFLAPCAVRKLHPQLIHAVLETFAGLALHFCRFTVPHARRLLTLQTLNRSFLKRYIVRSTHRVTAISSALRQTAVSLGRKDVIVVPNGIDRKSVELRLPAGKVGTANFARVPGRILFVGRLEHMKGVDTLLNAFAAVSGEFPQAHLRIVGDGSLLRQLTAHSAQLGIADRVMFLGYIPSPAVYDEYAQAQIFCALSRSEALGNVFLEAQAAGCAVIGTAVGGIPEIVADGRTGILVSPDSVTAATKALRRLLKDDALREQIAEEGRRCAAAYDWGAIAERYGEIYDLLLR